MLNSSQKRFRKEMKKIMKIQKRKKQSPVLSHIEGDFIEYYTSPQRRVSKIRYSKSKVPGIIGFLCLVLFFTSFVVWERWKQHNPYTTNQASIKKEAIVDPKHKQVVEHLKGIQQLDQEISAILTNLAKGYGSAFQDSTIRSEYLTEGKKYQEQINTILINTIKTNHPKEMQLLYEKVIEKYKYASEAAIHALNSVQNGDRTSDSQYRVYLNKMNIAGQEQQIELTKVFDKVGIKWERTATGIKYETNVWYK